MNNPLRVLIVEDSEDDVLLLVRHLHRNGFASLYEVVETAEEMKEALDKQEWDIVISDYSMPNFDGLKALETLKESGLDLPFLIVSGQIGEEVAVAAMKAGAHDYLMKNNLARLGPAIERELKEAKERRERRQAEESLRESEERYRNLYLKTPAILHSIDAEGRLISVSDTWLEKFGYKREEVIGRRSLDFLTKESRQFSIKEALSQMIERGKARKVPLQFVKRSGEVMDTLLSAAVELTENGDFLRSVAVIEDITERKKAEEALIESEKRYRSLYTKTPVMLHSVDADRKLVSVSDYWLENLGYEFEEVIGQQGSKFLTDASRDHAENVGFPEFFKTGIIKEKELQFVKKTGEVIDVLLSAIIERDAEGKISSTMSVLIDVTERKKAEESVERLRKKNELILESAGEGIYGLDNKGNTTFLNPAAVEILGWERDDLIGKSQHKLIHHTYHDGTPYSREKCPIYAALKDGKVYNIDDEVFWKKDGTSLPVEYTSTPIWDDEDTLVGSVITFRNITERRKAEKDLKDALNQVEQLKDKLQAENVYLQEEIKFEHNFDEIIGSSESFKRVLNNVQIVAETDATVLILGETGTGKELIARALHKLSPRKERTLVKVNCAALPAELIESELFGHEKGAFTSAMFRKEGRFELANGGTIFLDEIGDLPLDQQAKILRVLQEGEFERVGGTKTLKVDVRVIAATNVNLEKSVEDGDFREDLFYRLNVFPILLPPLRERQEDIPLLIKHFVNKYSSKFAKEIIEVSRHTMNSLQNYHYQGNIRELENIIERAVILAQDKILRLDENLSSLKSPASLIKNGETLEEVERKYITDILNETNWQIEGKNGAAPRLGLKPSTLRSRMQKLEIKKPVNVKATGVNK